MFKYLRPFRADLLWAELLKHGDTLVRGWNRASASMNELIIIALVIGTLTLTGVFFCYWLKKEPFNCNMRLFIYLYLTSLFVLIPLYKVSGGFFAILSKMAVVNRLYYSSSIFLVLPVCMYWIVKRRGESQRKTVLLTHLGISLCLFLAVTASSMTSNKAYIKNLVSIRNSFSVKKVDFHLSNEDQLAIGVFLESLKRKNDTGRPIMFFARPDVAFVLKYVFRENAFLQDRFDYENYKDKYKKALNEEEYKDYTLVLFETPVGFPDYLPFH